MGAADIAKGDGIKIDGFHDDASVFLRCTVGAGGFNYQMIPDEARRLARALNVMADAVDPVRPYDGAGTVTAIWGQPSLSGRPL